VKVCTPRIPEKQAPEGAKGARYGIPTNVVTLCPVSASDTREFATVMPEPWARLLLAEVSQGMSVHGGEPET
jgi:hypothetical protein